VRRPWLFGAITLAAGWLLQVVLLHAAPGGAPLPQPLLLAVLALGGLGHTVPAQTMGLVWGLSLDVFGLSLFGTQGLILSFAGYAAGRFSRQLNVEKLATQEALAVLGSLGFTVGGAMVDAAFRSSSGLWLGTDALWRLLMNAAVAPAVFAGVRLWAGLWGQR
jgi:cell shape-determining protein MreD